MNCEQVKSEVPDYLANSLSQESSAAIQSHLVMCGACRQELATLQSAWTRLGVLEDASPVHRCEPVFMRCSKNNSWICAHNQRAE